MAAIFKDGNHVHGSATRFLFQVCVKVQELENNKFIITVY